jgi:hypothetical protein
LDFTKSGVNMLQAGADNLVFAVANQEGANLLALQSRQSLSTTALSLTAQSDQEFSNCSADWQPINGMETMRLDR